MIHEKIRIKTKASHPNQNLKVYKQYYILTMATDT